MQKPRVEKSGEIVANFKKLSNSRQNADRICHEDHSLSVFIGKRGIKYDSSSLLDLKFHEKLLQSFVTRHRSVILGFHLF